MSKLAILGGPPVRESAWPQWPQGNSSAERYLTDVLYSGRWGIGGKYNGTALYNLRFMDAFSRFHDVPFCITVANGSAALAIALESLGVGLGDEVIVPGLAWISCASAVTRIGAVPVLVDVEPATLCISAESTRRAISDRTRAILVVHAYCTVADLDAFISISEETGIPVLEDCSQAHGAQWRRRRVGTFGKIGVFSMGNSKALSSGEGGAVITSDPKLHDVLQQLSSDGYRYSKSPPRLGESQLEEGGSVQGYNYCLSEFQAAVLLGGLENLDSQNRLREENCEYFRQLCDEVGDIVLLSRHPNIDRLTCFRLCVRLDLDAFGGATIKQVQKALIAELSESTIELVDHPLNDYALYRPMDSVGARGLPSQREKFDSKRFELPVASQAYKECLTLHHAMLLGGRHDVEDIVRAFVKLKAHGALLREV